MKAVIILRRPDPKSSKLVVPYILGVEMGLWSQKTLSESDESCNFPREFRTCPQTLDGQIASGTHQQPCSKPTLAIPFPPPQIRNLYSKSLNQEIKSHFSQVHLLFESKGHPYHGPLNMSWALKFSGHERVMTLFYSTINCLPSHVCINVIIANIRSVKSELVDIPAFCCSSRCLGGGG